MTKSERIDFSPNLHVPDQEPHYDVYWGYAQRMQTIESELSAQAKLYKAQGVPTEEIGEELDALRCLEGGRIAHDLWERTGRIYENIVEAGELGIDPQVMIRKKDAFLTGLLLGMVQVGGRNRQQLFPYVSLSVPKKVSDPYTEFSLYRVVAIIGNPDNPEQTRTISSRISELVPHVQEATGYDVNRAVVAKQLIQRIEHDVVDESPDDYVLRRFFELKDIDTALAGVEENTLQFRDLSLMRTQCERDLLMEWSRRKRDGNDNSSVSLRATQIIDKNDHGRKTIDLRIRWGDRNWLSAKADDPWSTKKTDANGKLRKALHGLRYDQVLFI